MGSDDFLALQEHTIAASANLACGGDDVKMKIIDFPGLLQALVINSGRADSPVVQEEAVRAVTILSTGGRDLKAKIIDFPGLLQALVIALGRAVSPVVQERAVVAVCCLSIGGRDIKAKIIDFPGLLQILVSTVVRDDFLAFQKQATSGVEDHDYVVKRYCGSALADFAESGDEIIKKMIVGFPEIVDVLVGAMAKGDYRDTKLGDGMFTLTLLSPLRAKEMQLVSAMAYLGRGRGELILGLYKEALEDFGKYWASLSGTLVENQDAKVLRLIHTGSCYAKAKLGDLPGALADADSVVQVAIGTDSAFALRERGVVKCMMGDLTGALVDLDMSLGLNDALVDLGMSLGLNDNYDYEVLKHRGFVKCQLRDEEGASADAERALECKPSRVDESHYGRSFLGETSVHYLNFELR